MANEKYLRLITSEHATKPKYMAYVRTFLDMLNAVETCLLSFDLIFNIYKELPDAEDPSDPEPGTKESTVDQQLDMLGSLLGLSRALPIVDEDIPSLLDNETYQKVIRSKILSDHWDGTNDGLREILDVIYPDLTYEIIDTQDMEYTISILNPAATDLEIALLFNGFILPKPSGVKVNYIVLDSPLFGWDSNTDIIQGWDLGQWN